ncbi:MULTISPECIES: hypothetical protein [unclassified Oleiphilus]|uniref:hypothetical protein n=2 Tax=Oleiphilus TaxID=141450 RepID=UPI000A8B6DBD|nr:MULTISPECIES: hypothetical protein [unclassified Oleiphilus]
MSSIPSKLLMLKTLSEVPRSEYSDVRVPKNLNNTKERLGFLKMLRQKPSAQQKVSSAKPRLLTFNAAVWLSLAQAAKKPVSLWLSYKDAQGENTILVDEQCMGESKSAMLSGNVSFKVSGNLEYLRACCGGVDEKQSLVVEELHVRRLKQEITYPGQLAQTA